MRQAGYIDEQNVAIEYRWADGHYDRLPDLVADLIRQHVAVIAAAPAPSAVAAKRATDTIPIVFEVGADPVRLGIVASFNRPGGNVTGIVNLSATVLPKRVEFMHDIVPSAELIAVLVNPESPIAQSQMDDVRAAQKLLNVRTELLLARTLNDIQAAFPKLREMRAGALVIASDTYLTSQWDEIAALATRYAIPTSHERPEFVTAGGLMSYGANLADAYRLAGIYTGRVLKGEKPSNLPIQQATKVELLINLKAAKGLGLTVPPALLARADEVIE